MTSQTQMLEQMFRDDKMIYFLSGESRHEAIERFDSEYADVMKITSNTIIDEDIGSYLSKITVKFLLSTHFTMDLSEFNLVPDGDLKNFLHSEYAELARNLLKMKPASTTNKLFVLVGSEDNLRALSQSITIRSSFINFD